MKQFTWGALLGLVFGAVMFWFEGSSHYFPALLAAMVLIAILIPLEKQEKNQQKLLNAIQELSNRLDGVGATQTGRPVNTPAPQEKTFMPAIQSHAPSSAKPISQGKRTVDRSLKDVAQKLASIQGR